MRQNQALLYGTNKKNKVMKKLLALTLLLITALAGNAQPPGYDDLRILYADENYEKLVKVAENYTGKEDLSKDALPHMWMARGLYKISESGEADEKFKTAFKDACGALGKCVKLDVDHSVRDQYAEFFDQFKNALLERITNDMSQPNGHKKASAWVLKYYKLEPASPGAKFMDGVCKFRNADKGGANTCWKEADVIISKTASIEGWSPADKELLKQGVVQTVTCWGEMRQGEKAKALLNKVAPWFEGDEEFKAVYDKYGG